MMPTFSSLASDVLHQMFQPVISYKARRNEVYTFEKGEMHTYRMLEDTEKDNNPSASPAPC